MISISKMILIPAGALAAGAAVIVPISSALNDYKPSKVTTIIESESNFKDTKKIIEQVATQEQLNRIKDSSKDEFISDTLNKKIDNVVSHTDFEFENKKKKTKNVAPKQPIESNKDSKPAPKEIKPVIKPKEKPPVTYRSINHTNTHDIRF